MYILTREQHGENAWVLRDWAKSISEQCEWTKLKVRREESLKVMRIWYHFAIGNRSAYATMKIYVCCWALYAAAAVATFAANSRKIVQNNFTIIALRLRCLTELLHRMFDVCSICVFAYDLWRVKHTRISRTTCTASAPKSVVSCAHSIFCSTFYRNNSIWCTAGRAIRMRIANAVYELDASI